MILDIVRRPIIRFASASFGFPGGVTALDDITLDIHEGEFIGVIGPNGSGKTTLCRAILGLLPPRTGTLQIFDCACEDMHCHHRARIGYLPQMSARDRHFPITVFETVMMGRYGALGLLKRPGTRDREIATQALTKVGMEGYADHALGLLSGGQQQRVMIARTLAQEPQVLLLDEPTTGIDMTTQQQLLDLVRHLHREMGLTVLFVTHDLNLISPHVDRLVLLNRRLAAAGPPAEVLQPHVLQSVYDKNVVVSDEGLVVVQDYHHHH
ncbi:MAG: metal ABC transporter ATP-binding protein [Nitrospiraceae bacterium]